MKTLKDLFLESKIVTVTINKNVSVKGEISNEIKVKELAKDYDWFTSMIDSYSQQQKAEAENKNILKELKALGADEISHNDFSTPMSSSRVKTIKL